MLSNVATLSAALPWLLLMGSLLAGFLHLKRSCLILVIMAGGLALTNGEMSPIALTLSGVGLLGAWVLRIQKGTIAILGHLALIGWALALALHLVPGFTNFLALDTVQSSPSSVPYSLYLNFDKPQVFLLLLLAWPALLSQDTPLRWRPLLMSILSLVSLLPLATSLGAIHLDPSWPQWAGIFLLANLLQTCLVEEAFFRGYLQKLLTARVGPVAGIMAASLLFGLAHIGGGLLVVGMATLLGATCGLGLWFSGRLWVAVFMHFAFNALHLIAFTYPAPL